jgi:hypothetical protein
MITCNNEATSQGPVALDKHVAAALRNIEIGKKLLGTVKIHLHNFYQKLARYAQEKGLV